ITAADLTDPWGRRYYAVFKTQSGYVDRVTFHAGRVDSIDIVPVTQQTQVIRLGSAGPDGIAGDADDFTVMSFVRPTTQQAVEDPTPRIAESPITLGPNGALEGVVVDGTGARIPGVTVKV